MNKRYFDFLCDIVGRTEQYGNLLARLYELNFYSLVPNDDNRAADGEQLRIIFLDEKGKANTASSFSDLIGACTVLEMLIGVASRLEFDLSGSRWERTVGEWFWVLIDNIGLEWCDDMGWEMEDREQEVDERIDILLERKYGSDGNGGLFPLKNPKKDQRDIEIWYQMSAWIIENYPI